MKSILLPALLILAVLTPLHAAPAPRGPQGGRLLALADGQAEFIIQPDRRVRLAFYDALLKPVDPGARSAAVTAQAPGGGVKLEMEARDAVLASKVPLPPGEGYFIVVQIREDPEGKPKNFRIRLDLSHCAGCALLEYACVCEGH